MKHSVVFIGDSITDCGRTYPTVSEYGYGFAAKCISELQARFPQIDMYNRGIAGQCIGEIASRWQSDCLDLSPIAVTLFAGINDVDFSYRHENHAFDEAKLTQQLEYMCASVHKAGAKLILIQPYAFDGELYKDAFQPRLIRLQAITKQSADKYADAYINLPMQPELTVDGLHPTEEGHKLIAKTWLKAAEECGVLEMLKD